MVKSDKYNLIDVFKEFLSATQRNKRMLRGGRKMPDDSKKNYIYLLRLMESFQQSTGFELRLRNIRNNSRVFDQERRYFNRLYMKFTNFLYDDRGHFDNYVGHNIKLLKAFFKWVSRHKGIAIGDFYRDFFVWKEDIQIVVLEPDQLNFLITDLVFEQTLSDTLRRTKDLFVFGCTVALRISDLLNLKTDNLEHLNGLTYLKVISQKTNTYTRIKLPQYAVDILDRNKGMKRRLFLSIDPRNFNKNIKKLMELAGWIYDFPKMRTKRGIPHIQMTKTNSKKHHRFCDLVSTHTMRRTAITTMLNLGVEEATVRKISGHAPGSNEFYKYVKYNQQRVDQQTDLMFEKLLEKTLI